MEDKKLQDIFCANEQKVTPHEGSIDGNGEFVFTCECGRALKFPKDTTPEQFKEYLAAHQDQNEGDVTVDSQKKKLDELLGNDQNSQE